MPRYDEITKEQMMEARARERQQLLVEYKHKHMYRAILSPFDFDNYHFWDLVYEENAQWIDVIGRAADNAGYSEIVVTHLRFEADALVCNPRLETWAFRVSEELNKADMLKLMEIVIASVKDESHDVIESVRKAFGQPTFIPKEDNTEGFDLYPGVISNQRFTAPAARITAPSSSIWLTVLNGFMMAAGALAIVVAFAALNASTFGMSGLAVAGLGIGLMIGGGYGFFKQASQQPASGLNMNSVPSP